MSSGHPASRAAACQRRLAALSAHVLPCCQSTRLQSLSSSSSAKVCNLVSSAASIGDSFPPVIPHVLIVGGNGVVGRAAVQLFDSQGPAWRVTAATKDVKLHFPTQAVQHISVDLTDATACESAFARLHDVTHVVYAAMFEKTDDVFASFGSAEEVETNDLMLQNCILPLASVARGLKSVQILQGGKAYGVHKIGIRSGLTPYRERDPRVEHGPSFYWRQEDFIKAQQKASGGAWHYTIWRPSLMFGYSSVSPFNFLFALAVHAVVMRELGRPLSYTGYPAKIVNEFCDTRLQAKAFLWAANAPAAANQAFNITNGDHMIWQNMYPKIATFLGMECGAPEPVQLDVEMRKPEVKEAWAKIVKKHGLVKDVLDEINFASFRMADFNLGMTAPLPADWRESPLHGLRAGMINSTIRLRQAGFHECMDTEDTLLDWFREMQELRVIPK